MRVSLGGARQHSTYIVVVILLATALLFGGSSRPEVLSTTLVRLVATLALAYAIATSSMRPSKEGWFLITVFCLIGIQLCPLPYELWSNLPGREVEKAIVSLLPEKRPWEPISFYPLGTWNALLSWLPPAATFWLARRCDTAQRTLAMLLVASIGMFSALLGLVQMGQGESSLLRFYAITNPDAAVGFFANRNHDAALLAASTVIILWWSGAAGSAKLPRARRRILGLAAAGSLLTGLIATGSRAGIALGLAGFVVSLCFFQRDWLRTAPKRYLLAAGAGLITSVCVSWALFHGLLARLFATSPADDLRFIVLPDLLHIARDVFPAGAGYGTFDATYRIYERVETMRSTYLNHAHNDLVELVIEGGLPALGMLALSLVWVARCLWRLKNFSAEPALQKAAVAATLVMVLLLLHSLLDYPLRTPALSCVFALCAAVLSSAVATKKPPEDETVGFVDSSKGAG